MRKIIDISIEFIRTWTEIANLSINWIKRALVSIRKGSWKQYFCYKNLFDEKLNMLKRGTNQRYRFCVRVVRWRRLSEMHITRRKKKIKTLTTTTTKHRTHGEKWNSKLRSCHAAVHWFKPIKSRILQIHTKYEHMLRKRIMRIIVCVVYWRGDQSEEWKREKNHQYTQPYMATEQQRRRQKTKERREKM